MNPSDLLQASILINILSATIRISTPLLLAATGELMVEKSGVLNLGVEGMMLTGAFIAFLVTDQSGSLLLALFLAMIAGAMMSLLFAYMACSLKVNQIVAGMSLNMLGLGVTGFWLRLVYSDTDSLAIIGSGILNPIQIPWLSRIPIVGEIIFNQNLLTYLAFLLVPLIWLFLKRTKYGLRVRSVGEDPRAVDMRGLSVNKLQYLSTIFGGIMAGLGGAFVSIGSSTRFVPEMTAGRGWLAIVIVIAGNWQPFRIMIATLIFAFLDAFQLQVQGIGIQMPYQILLALPYIFAILVVIGSRARSIAPSHLGIPYSRE